MVNKDNIDVYMYDILSSLDIDMYSISAHSLQLSLLELGKALENINHDSNYNSNYICENIIACYYNVYRLDAKYHNTTLDLFTHLLRIDIALKFDNRLDRYKDPNVFKKDVYLKMWELNKAIVIEDDFECFMTKDDKLKLCEIIHDIREMLSLGIYVYGKLSINRELCTDIIRRTNKPIQGYELDKYLYREYVITTIFRMLNQVQSHNVSLFCNVMGMIGSLSAIAGIPYMNEYYWNDEIITMIKRYVSYCKDIYNVCDIDYNMVLEVCEKVLMPDNNGNTLKDKNPTEILINKVIPKLYNIANTKWNPTNEAYIDHLKLMFDDSVYGLVLAVAIATKKAIYLSFESSYKHI